MDVSSTRTILLRLSNITSILRHLTFGEWFFQLLLNYYSSRFHQQLHQLVVRIKNIYYLIQVYIVTSECTLSKFLMLVTCCMKMILSEVIEVCTEEQKCIVYCANNLHHTNIWCKSLSSIKTSTTLQRTHKLLFYY